MIINKRQKEKRPGLPGSNDEIKEASDRNPFWQLLLNCLENNELNYTPHAPSARERISSLEVAVGTIGMFLTRLSSRYALQRVEV